MGKFLFVGMIVLLVAMVANMFLQIPALALTISTLVIVVFSLFLLYDLQRIVSGGETNYVMATTGVYLSLLQHLRQPAAPAAGADRRARLTRSSSTGPTKGACGRPFRLSALEQRDALDVRGVREHVDHARGGQAEALRVAPARRRRAPGSPGRTRRRRCAAATPSGSDLTSLDRAFARRVDQQLVERP